LSLLFYSSLFLIYFIFIWVMFVFVFLLIIFYIFISVSFSFFLFIFIFLFFSFYFYSFPSLSNFESISHYQAEEKESTMNLIQSVKTDISKWVKLDEDDKYLDLFSEFELKSKKYSSVLKAIKKSLSSSYKVCFLSVCSLSHY
jgi:energy-coupling factor transporter transmembrane protein EcfT